MRVAVVGVGKLGEALVAGLVGAGHEVIGSERSADRAAVVSETYGIALMAVEDVDADVVVLAVKPPDVRPTAASLAVTPLVVSVAAGITTAAIEAVLPPGTPVVRVMPNTPAFVGEGMSAISAGSSAGPAELDVVEELLSTVGLVVRVPESQQDAVTAVSGSGPAYFFAVVEAMAAAGAQLGLPEDVAMALARQTLVGAGKLLGSSEQSAGELRQAVTSPGGTTAAALAAMDLEPVFLAALTAARDRSIELAG